MKGNSTVRRRKQLRLVRRCDEIRATGRFRLHCVSHARTLSVVLPRAPIDHTFLPLLSLISLTNLHGGAGASGGAALAAPGGTRRRGSRHGARCGEARRREAREDGAAAAELAMWRRRIGRRTTSGSPRRDGRRHTRAGMLRNRELQEEETATTASRQWRGMCRRAHGATCVFCLLQSIAQARGSVRLTSSESVV
jgi:hypothetical protein